MPVAVSNLGWEDIKDMPESHGRTEIVDGELVELPLPPVEHQEISVLLGDVIRPYVRQRSLGKFFPIPIHIILAEHVNFEPDLCFIKQERMAILESGVCRGAPDLVIEIISESNRTHDTVVKFANYEKYGVPEYWLVDQRDPQIRVFHTGPDGKYRLIGVFRPGETVGTPTFPDLQLDPRAIFPTAAV